MTPPGKLGTVKMFDPGRGFGFIVSDSNAEYYFHCTAIESGCLPEPGDRVKFIAGFSRDGRARASRVALLSEA
jgi:cold shock CspA family protein